MKTAIYPGSFDPFTNGHLDIVGRASRLFDRLIVCLAVNSSKSSLFTTPERLDLMKEVLAKMENVSVATFDGLLVDFARQNGACAIVRGLRAVTDFDYEYAIYQINHEMEPGIDTMFLLASKEYSFLSSTIIKEAARYGRASTTHIPEPVRRAILKKFGHTV